MPDNWDEIITAASSSYGLIALALLVVGSLAVPMTKNASPNMRSGIFVFLVVAFIASLGFATTQIPHTPQFAPGVELTDDVQPTSPEVLGHLRDLDVELIDDNTFVLALEEQLYIQALGGGDSFYMEFREGSADKHFQCTVDGRDMVAAFTAFKAGTNSWRTICDWQKLTF